MNSSGTGPRIVHLGADPSEAALLDAELRGAGIGLAPVHVSSSPALQAALEGNDVAVVVADLPLPFASAAAELAELQRTRPELRVVFRTGSAGRRSIAAPTSPTVDAVRSALDQRPEAPEAREEHRRLVAQLVAAHAVQLRLSQRDLWDFDDALRDITQSGAELLGVERVSVWDVDPVTRGLVCLISYDRPRGMHRVEERLEMPASYVAALESAMFLAADDAQNDPRTSALTAEYLAPLGIRSLLDAPVRRDGRIIGVLCHEHCGPLRHWTLLDQCNAAAMAEIVARAFGARDRRLAEARLRESEKFEMLGRFSGRLAHDFKNLLTVILGNAELALARGKVDDSDRELLSQIVRAGQDATELIRQLLLYSRRDQARPRVLDLREQVAQILPLAARLLGDEVRVLDQLGDEPLWVEIDPLELQQVLLNLASNSRDAMPGGGEFRVSLARRPAPAAGMVRRGAEPPAAGVVLRVSDTGSGIAPEDLPRIFEPFFTTKSPRLGSGLGLFSVREIVRRAGGDVRAWSVPDGGTRIEVVLPAAAVPAEASRDHLAGPGPAGTPHGGTVLVVAPPGEARDALRDGLLRLGFSVVEARGAVEALEVLARGTTFDWVATLQALPRMEGARLVGHLRDFRPRMPALIVLEADTAESEVGELGHLERTGPTGVLRRPYSADDLAARARELRARR